MFRFVLLFSVVAVINVQSTPVDQCTYESGPLPISTDIEGCSSLPCIVPQYQDAVIHMAFRARNDIKSMRTYETVFFPPGPPYGYPLIENAETCNFLRNAKCPIQQDDIVHYTLKVPLHPSFPKGSKFALEFKIEDSERLSPVACIRVRFNIVDPVPVLD
ncbi:unnamed protein product [Chrysodeixis includens]|uniref:MD-2-related lipid-recognition domain-containing protein n=1 Tax=Chrysodeixis includens TaxID=689277 RepID=A0A9P0BWA2_CHRIL|nr:unnamed protein product [Chrysodeixis includens]